MKLLFDCTELSYINDFSGKRAGVFIVALNLLKEFQKRNINIFFVCDYRRYYIMKDLKEFADVKLLPENSFVNKLWGKLFYHINNRSRLFKYFFVILSRLYDRYFYKENWKNIEQLKGYEVYFSPFTAPSKEIQNSDLKKFRILHDLIPLVENYNYNNLTSWCYKIYATINDADYYFTDSENTKNDILKYFPFVPESHIKTALLGANENFKPVTEQSPVDGKYIFSLCTLGRRKNLEFGIRNFFEFIRKNNIDDLKLVLGGSIWEKYKNELDRILDKYDRSKIILTGYIEDSDLAKYYSNALCFIYPSLYEGFGLPVLEAMQCGCPVITSNTSSLPEVIGDAGIKINPESDEEMIAAYEKMYFDEKFREECSQKGLKRANQFSWEKCANGILEFINNTLSV